MKELILDAQFESAEFVMHSCSCMCAMAKLGLEWVVEIWMHQNGDHNTTAGQEDHCNDSQ